MGTVFFSCHSLSLSLFSALINMKLGRGGLGVCLRLGWDVGDCVKGENGI